MLPTTVHCHIQRYDAMQVFGGCTAAHFVGEAFDRHSRCALDWVRHLQEVSLEMEVVDGAKCTQGVVSQAEVGAVHLLCALQCE